MMGEELQGEIEAVSATTQQEGRTVIEDSGVSELQEAETSYVDVFGKQYVGAQKLSFAMLSSQQSCSSVDVDSVCQDILVSHENSLDLVDAQEQVVKVVDSQEQAETSVNFEENLLEDSQSPSLTCKVKLPSGILHKSDAVNIYDDKESDCETPKSEEHRIPPMPVCPPAPCKPKARSRSNTDLSSVLGKRKACVEFFTPSPEDLEALFGKDPPKKAKYAKTEGPTRLRIPSELDAEGGDKDGWNQFKAKRLKKPCNNVYVIRRPRETSGIKRSHALHISVQNPMQSTSKLK